MNPEPNCGLSAEVGCANDVEDARLERRIVSRFASVVWIFDVFIGREAGRTRGGRHAG